MQIEAPEISESTEPDETSTPNVGTQNKAEPLVTTSTTSNATTYFFPDLLGDGRSISVDADSRDAAEKQARQQLDKETSTPS